MASGNPYLDDAPAAPAGNNPYLDDTPPPAAAPPSTGWGFREYAVDGIRSLGSGVSKGVAGLVGLPADALRLGQAGLDYSQSIGQGRPFQEVAVENRAQAPGVANALKVAGSESIQAASPLAYEPQSRVGKFIQEGANFATQAAALPIGGATALGRAVGAGGAVAGIASEGAGQIADAYAPGAAPYARLAGALTPAGVAGYAQAPSAAQRAAVTAAREVPREEIGPILDRAQALIDDAAANGTTLSTFQAVDQASGGRLNLSELQRHAEGMGRLRSFFADMGDLNRSAFTRQAEGVGSARADTSALGGEVGQAARAGVAATPEGRALSEAQAALGPRVEAREAGQAMQEGLTQTYDRREGMRAALAERDYDAARNAPNRISIDQRAEPSPVDPIARRMSENPSSLPGQTPVEPRVGQVDPSAALAHIDEALLNAKGAQRDALRNIRRDMFDANGQLDLTAEGNMAAARAIQSVADVAARNGDNTTAGLMGQARTVLTGAMETTPEIATANRTFASGSRNLDNFDGARPLGRIVERDRASGRPALDPEQVPGQIQGSTAAREFNELAPTEARRAYQGRLTTEVMDAAGGENATGEAIRAQITRDYDRLREHPEVLARLNARAEAGEGLAAVRASPLGQLAERNPTTREAVAALFRKGEDASTVSSEEIGRAVSALVATNPTAAGQLVRVKLEGAFKTAAGDLNTVAGQMGAAKFRNALMKNTKEAADIRAAVRALPDGETVMNGLDRLLEVFQAQGLRQNVGSKTAYNQQFLDEAKGGPVAESVAKAVVAPLKLPARFRALIEEWRLGKNMDQIAALVANPDARAAFRGLLRSGDVSGPVGRLAAIAQRSQSSGALQIRVSPRTED